MGALMRAHDWSATPVGLPDTWPQSLRTAVRLLLNTGHPMYIWWGAQGTCLYNDAYSRSIGSERHPGSLGQPARAVWEEIWDIIGPQIEQVMAGRGATWHENQLVPITRDGQREDVYWTYGYSPIDEESAPNDVGGVLVTCVETTQQVLAARHAVTASERQRRMFEQAPGFICTLHGPDHVFDFVNDAYKRLFGDRLFVGTPVRDALPEIEGQGFLELLDRVYATGERHVASRTPIRLRDTLDAAEKERFLDFIYEPMLDESGQIAGIFCEGHDVTEAHQAETVLRETEERSRRIVEGVKDHAIFITDADGVVVDWTPGAEAIFQWSADEIVGQPAELLFTPEDRSNKVPTREFAIARAEGCANDERWHIRRDGSRFFANGSVRSLHGAAGEVTGFIKIARDETARRAAESALDENRSYLRLLLDSAGEAFYAVDSDGVTTLCNQAFVALTGFAREEDAVGRELHHVIHHAHSDGRDYRKEDCPIYQCAKTGEPAFVTDECFYRLDGSAFPVEYRVRPIIREGELSGAICTFSDISGRLAMEAASREQMAEFQALADNMPALCWMAYADGSIYWYNRRWHEYTGTTAEDQEGWGWQSVHDPEILPRVIERWERSIESGTPFDMTFPLKGADGVFRPFLTRVVPICSDDGAVERWFGTNVDITDQERTRAELRELNETLERRIEERTSELMRAEEALRQSQKMEAIGSLTGGVAHDFNNLLTPILGSLDLLQRKHLGGERERRLIDGALQSAERAKTLVQRLLAFARRQPLKSGAVDVAALIEGMGDLVASTSGPRVRLEIDLAPDLPPAQADPNQLEMAILNLAVNARDAMPDGGRLTILARQEEVGAEHRSQLPRGRYVRLSVADTGIGMDEATIARSVEPFFSTKGIGKGTGLGLSMVHGLAAQLGGALTITSKPGLGTNVELWLPATEAPATPAERPQIAETGPAAGIVLLVDDEELVRMSTADMLADLGYAVIEANSAEEALRLLDDNPQINLLVTDHLMPGMTGTELAREVRSKQPDVAVLIVSGYADVEGIAPDLPRLTKPFRQIDLAASVAALAPVSP